MCKNFIFVFRCHRCGAWDHDTSLVLPGRQFPSTPTSIFTPGSLSLSQDEGGVKVAGTETMPGEAVTHPAVVAQQVNQNTAGFLCKRATRARMKKRSPSSSKSDGDDKEKNHQPRGTKRTRMVLWHRSPHNRDIGNSSDEEDEEDDDKDRLESWEVRQRCPRYAMRRNVVTFLDRFCSARCLQAHQLHLPLNPSPLRNMESAPTWEPETSKESPPAAAEDEGWSRPGLRLRHTRKRMQREQKGHEQEQNKNKSKKRNGAGGTRKAMVAEEATPAVQEESVLQTGLGVVETGNSPAEGHDRLPLSDRHEHDAGDTAGDHDGEAGHEENEPPRKKRVRTPLPGL